MAIKGKIAFDIDGTLFDTKPGIINALEEVFERFDLGDFDKAHGKKYIGPPIKQSLIKYNRLTEEVAAKATEYYRKIYVEKYIMDTLPYKNAYVVLSRFKEEGYTLSVATMKTKKQIKKLFEIFEQYGMLFDEIYTAKEDGSIKKADMLRKLKKRDRSTSVYMIGDTEGDYLAAKKTNVNFVGVTYGYGFTSNQEYDFPIAKNINDIFFVVDGLNK